MKITTFLLSLCILFLSCGIFYLLLGDQYLPHPAPAISKDSHQWYPQPTPVTDYDLGPDLLGLPSEYAKAWYVGQYVSLTNILGGSKIMLAVFRDYRPGTPIGSGGCDTITRLFLSKPAATFLYYDAHYSPEDITVRGYTFKSSNHPFIFEHLDIAFIPSLEFPGFVMHNNQTYVREQNPYECFVIDQNGKTNLFFEDIKPSLTPLFWDKVLGQAYSDPVKKDIVFRSPDSTYVRYELKK